MIPKIIHYCWVGNAPKPKSVLYCIESRKNFAQIMKFESGMNRIMILQK